jgi:hypothetical protein
MHWKVPFNDGFEVSLEMASDFVPVLKVQAAYNINDSSLLFLVFRTC